MDQETLPPLTPLDMISCGSQLQMMKALVPYLHPKSQKSFAMFLKLLELQNLAAFFDQETDLAAADLSGETASPVEILKEISNYAYPADRERLNQSRGILEAIQMMQALNGGLSTDALLKNFLTPEQQEMFEAYKSMNLSS